MSTYLDALAGGKGNPLLQGLLDLAQSKGGLTVSEIADYVKTAGNIASNLHRIGADGLTHTTSVVALYTKSLDDNVSAVRAGNIATDMSLRSADVVAIDTTPAGRLLIKLEQLANGAADPDGILNTLRGTVELGDFKDNLNTASEGMFDTASRNLIKHNKGEKGTLPVFTDG